MLNTRAMQHIYYSLIYSHLFYCHTVWGAAGKFKTNSLMTAQKRTIRTMSYLKKYDHTNESFKTLRLLKYKDINTYCCALYVYKSVNNHISNDFFQFRVNERYPLRNNNILDTPYMRTTQSQTSIRYHGVKVWNDLPSFVKEKTSVTSFKKALKLFLLSQY